MGLCKYCQWHQARTVREMMNKDIRIYPKKIKVKFVFES